MGSTMSGANEEITSGRTNETVPLNLNLSLNLPIPFTP